MELQQILDSLCAYDPRNPYYLELDDDEKIDVSDPNRICYCDNCFQGKTRLAVELLKFIELKPIKK